jgi:hypothetical protein
VRIWQTDGRPMSGDLGRGATLSAVRFGAAVLGMGLGLGQHVQLAGGTNGHTARKLAELGLLGAPGKAPGTFVSGAAFGGHARKVLDQCMGRHGLGPEEQLQDHPEVRGKGWVTLRPLASTDVPLALSLCPPLCVCLLARRWWMRLGWH